MAMLCTSSIGTAVLLVMIVVHQLELHTDPTGQGMEPSAKGPCGSCAPGFTERCEFDPTKSWDTCAAKQVEYSPSFPQAKSVTREFQMCFSTKPVLK